MGIPDGKKYQEIGISQLVQRFYFCIVVFKGIRNPDLEAGKEAPDRRDADGETRLTRPMQARSVGNFLLAGSTEAAKTKQDKTKGRRPVFCPIPARAKAQDTLSCPEPLVTTVH